MTKTETYIKVISVEGNGNIQQQKLQKGVYRVVNVDLLDEAIAKFDGSSGNDRFRIFNSTVYDELVRSESK